LSRRHDRGLALLYVREYYLKADLSAARQAYGRQILAQAGINSNTDLKPQGLFYGLLLTGMEENVLLSRIMLWFKQVGVGRLYAALALLTLTLGVWRWIPTPKSFFLYFPFSLQVNRIRRRVAPNQTSGNGYPAVARCQQAPYLYSVFTVGITVMGLEMVVLILFQVTLGYLYGQLGLLLAAFMAGMAGGSYLAGGRLARGAPARGLALWSQSGLALLMLLLALSLPWLLRWPYLQEDGWGQLIFTVLLVSAGLLSGVVFAAQGELCQHQGTALSLSAGRLYAVDLLGATLGTLGMSFLVIPCLGPAQALFLGAAWNASAILVLAMTKAPSKGMDHNM
jgi:hypothetical protein